MNRWIDPIIFFLRVFKAIWYQGKKDCIRKTKPRFWGSCRSDCFQHHIFAHFRVHAFQSLPLKALMDPNGDPNGPNVGLITSSSNPKQIPGDMTWISLSPSPWRHGAPCRCDQRQQSCGCPTAAAQRLWVGGQLYMQRFRVLTILAKGHILGAYCPTQTLM
jgi:hypothetical protein